MPPSVRKALYHLYDFFKCLLLQSSGSAVKANGMSRQVSDAASQDIAAASARAKLGGIS